MLLAEHDNVVKTFPPDRTDRPVEQSVSDPARSKGTAEHAMAKTLKNSIAFVGIDEYGASLGLT